MEVSVEPQNAASEKKGGFRKVTFTLPQDMYERLLHESTRRKIAGAPNQMISALLREALSHYLKEMGLTEVG